MTIYFLKLKEWLENTLENAIEHERRNIGHVTTISGLYIALAQVKKLEAEFECKSLAEAGYF